MRQMASRRRPEHIEVCQSLRRRNHSHHRASDDQTRFSFFDVVSWASFRKHNQGTMLHTEDALTYVSLSLRSRRGFGRSERPGHSRWRWRHWCSLIFANNRLGICQLLAGEEGIEWLWRGRINIDRLVSWSYRLPQRVPQSKIFELHGSLPGKTRSLDDII